MLVPAAQRSDLPLTGQNGLSPVWESRQDPEPSEGRNLMYQARVLGWSKEKQYYFAHKSWFGLRSPGTVTETSQ
jgi:hypothetical protein